jgi:hypothetical protein
MLADCFLAPTLAVGAFCSSFVWPGITFSKWMWSWTGVSLKQFFLFYHKKVGYLRGKILTSYIKNA